MPGQPHDWNAIIVGAWNPAILTPEWLKRRLFEVPPEAPVEVEVAIDRPGTFRVRHGGIVAVPTPASLAIAPAECTQADLARACEIAARALAALPETPLAAVGINLRYGFDPMPADVTALMGSAIDQRFADADLRVTGRVMKRSVTWRDGFLNLELHARDGVPADIQFNFHLESADPVAHRAWLVQSAEMFRITDRIIRDVLRVQVQPEGEDADE